MFNYRNLAKETLTATSVITLGQELQPCTRAIRVLNAFVPLDFKGSTQYFLSKLQQQDLNPFVLRETILMLELCIEKEKVDVDTLFTDVSELLKLAWPFPSVILDNGNFCREC